MGRHKKGWNENNVKSSGLDKADITPLVAPNISDIQSSRMADIAGLGQPEIDPTATNTQEERSEKTPRKYKTKKQRQIELEEAKLLLIPVFDLISGVMEARGIDPLTQYERERGAEAWHPILEKYLPSIEAWGIWLPPAFWTVTIFMARKNQIIKKKVPENVVPITEVKKEDVKNVSSTNS